MTKDLIDGLYEEPTMGPRGLVLQMHGCGVIANGMPIDCKIIGVSFRQCGVGSNSFQEMLTKEV